MLINFEIKKYYKITPGATIYKEYVSMFIWNYGEFSDYFCRSTTTNGQAGSSTPLSSTMQDGKGVKPTQAQTPDQLQNQASPHQQTQTQQPQISQLQQMQNIFQQQQQIQGKPGAGVYLNVSRFSL